MKKLMEDRSCALEFIIKNLLSSKSISAAGIFGSYVRGEAVSASDLDLLVLDNTNSKFEYIERVNFDYVMIDLNYLPEKFLIRPYFSNIGQKIHEVKILFDHKGILTKAKEYEETNYWDHEHVKNRVLHHLLDADIYLSRGFSGLNKEDQRTARVYASIGLDSAFKILIEANKTRISNSHFIEALKDSAIKYEMNYLYNDYIKILGLNRVGKQRIEELLTIIPNLWQDAHNLIRENPQIFKSLHFNVRKGLNYYCGEKFLEGFLSRTKHMLKNGQYEESSHYVFRTTIYMLENVAWLLSALDKKRFDYVDLFKRLEKSKHTPTNLLEKAEKILQIQEVTKDESRWALRKAKEIILIIRKRRKYFKPK